MQAPALEIPRQTEDAFIRPFWGRALGAPWCASVLVLVLLTCARAYAMLGPPSARPLFLLQFLAMWALPFVLLTPVGRREIGLRKSGNAVAAFFWSALAARLVPWGLCAGPGIVRAIAPELERDRPRQLSPPGTARLDAWPSPLCRERSASHDLQPYRRRDPVSRSDSAGIYASLESRHRNRRELIQLWFGPLASSWNRKRRRRHSSAIPFGFTDGPLDGSD